MMSAPLAEDREVDELLAALGYKVCSSDMASVAQKLEQLEMAMEMGGVSAGPVPQTTPSPRTWPRRPSTTTQNLLGCMRRWTCTAHTTPAARPNVVLSRVFHPFMNQFSAEHCLATAHNLVQYGIPFYSFHRPKRTQ
jgi:hypothetical protein